MIRNGWHLYRHRLFAERINKLEQAVAALSASDPAGYKQHPKTKLLASAGGGAGCHYGADYAD